MNKNTKLEISAPSPVFFPHCQQVFAQTLDLLSLSMLSKIAPPSFFFFLLSLRVENTFAETSWHRNNKKKSPQNYIDLYSPLPKTNAHIIYSESS